MGLKSRLLNIGRVVHDASFVALERCPTHEKIQTLCQLVRVGLAPPILRGSAPAVGKKNFRVRYLDAASLWQVYHEIFIRHAYFFRAENETPLILDCGANIGMATLYFKTLYPRCTIEAFEPDPPTFSTLKENVIRNGLEGIHLHPCALWDMEGEVDFYVHSETAGELRMSVWPGRLDGHNSRITARAVPLSRFLKGRVVDFLKMDIEGAEERVLAEATRNSGLANVKQMAIEYHHPPGREPSHLARVLAMIEQQGFDYEVCADIRPLALQDPTHDVTIYARRWTPA